MILLLRQSRFSMPPVIIAVAALAIMPAAPAKAMISFELCNAAGETRTISIPIEQDDGEDRNCAKPCHACLSRSKIRIKPNRG